MAKDFTLDDMLAEASQVPGASSSVATRARRLGSGTATKAVALWGPPGSGKTRALKTLLEVGERLLVGDTEPSGDGISTVENLLVDEGRADLLNNLLYVPLMNFKEAWNFWGNPVEAVPDVADLQPTCLVWENFNYFQMYHADKEIMPDEFRPENVEGDKDAMFAYWDKMRRIILRSHHRFMTCAPCGPTHHILTMHDDDKERKIKGRLLYGPQIVGSSRKPILGSYSLVLRMDKRSSLFGNDSDSPYVYEAVMTDETQVKERASGLPEGEFPADFNRVWEAITRSNNTKET